MSANLRNLLFAAGLTVSSFANVSIASAAVSPTPHADAVSISTDRQQIVCENLSGSANDQVLSPFNLSCNGVC